MLLAGRLGRVLSAVVSMSSPIAVPELEVGGMDRIEWDLKGLYYSSTGQERCLGHGSYDGRRVSDQFCVEVSGHEDQVESYYDAMRALLTLGKERFHADAYELTGLMSYLWEEDKVVDGKEGDYVGFASAIFYRKD